MILINPGSGPIAFATYQKWAETNIRAFRRDIGLKGVTIEYRRGSRRGGRYFFKLTLGDRSTLVDMPGLRLARVRWTDDPEQNCLEFPRLYVDGGSWLWHYAVDVAHDALAGL